MYICYQIDIFEKDDKPLGLARKAIAPDHWEIKNTYQKEFDQVNSLQQLIKNTDHIHFHPSSDILEKEGLKSIYDKYSAIIFATGSSVSRKLNIENEENIRAIRCEDLFLWYNGQKSFSFQFPFDKVKKIAILG